METKRKKCKYPMSQFYSYEDEVPKDVRVSTHDDCEKCNEGSCKERCCLISDTQLQRKCFNHCPKCNAGENDIEWGDKDWAGDTAWQNATCNKCGCEFSEVYRYALTESKHNK